jgi:hypothetical protein
MWYQIILGLIEERSCVPTLPTWQHIKIHRVDLDLVLLLVLFTLDLEFEQLPLLVLGSQRVVEGRL